MSERERASRNAHGMFSFFQLTFSDGRNHTAGAVHHFLVQQSPRSDWEIFLQEICDNNGPGARPTAAVRRGESFMQVDVHDIKTKISWFYDAEQSIEICAIPINQSARVMDDPVDFYDLLFKQSKRVWVGEHQSSSGVIACFCQCFAIHISAPIRGDVIDLETCHVGSRWVSSVCGIRDQDFCAFFITIVFVIFMDDQSTNKFPVCAGCRL